MRHALIGRRGDRVIVIVSRPPRLTFECRTLEEALRFAAELGLRVMNRIAVTERLAEAKEE